MTRSCLVAVLLVAGGLAGPAFAEVPRAADRWPEGWTLYPRSTQLAACAARPGTTCPELECANFSQEEWRVSAPGGRLQVEPDRRSPAPVPEVLREAVLGMKQKQPKSRPTFLRIGNGWLLGIDAGEWGGSLWWFSPDGTTRQKLGDENVRGMVPGPGSTLVLTGLAHESSDRGQLLRVQERPGGARATLLVELGSEPAAWARESPAALLVLTTRNLQRVHLPAGRAETLLRHRYGSLYPGSLVVSSSGDLVLGLRHFVVRLVAVPGGSYREQWWVPRRCARFEARSGEPCRCLGP